MEEYKMTDISTEIQKVFDQEPCLTAEGQVVEVPADITFEDSEESETYKEPNNNNWLNISQEPSETAQMSDNDDPFDDFGQTADSAVEEAFSNFIPGTAEMDDSLLGNLDQTADSNHDDFESLLGELPPLMNNDIILTALHTTDKLADQFAFCTEKQRDDLIVIMTHIAVALLK